MRIKTRSRGGASDIMRILYVGLIPPEVGGKIGCGAAVHAWELAQQALSHGYEIYFATNLSSPKKLLDKDGIKIINMSRNKITKIIQGLCALLICRKNKLGLIFSFSLKNRISILSNIFYFNELLSWIKPDLIHVHGDNYLPISLNALDFSIPIIVSDHISHTRLTSDKKELWGIERTFQCADCIIFVSASLEKDEHALLKGFRGKKCVITNPIDPQKVPLTDKAEAKKTLGFDRSTTILFSGISDSIKRKGLDVLLLSLLASDYLKEEVQIVVIADVEGVEYSRSFFLKNKINGIAMGAQPWNKMINYYNAADVFVLPSRSEAFPLVFIESLLAGLPIIGYGPALKELEKLLGEYVGEAFDAERETPSDLASKIIRVLEMKLERKPLRNKIVSQLSWKKKFGEFDSIYRALRNESTRTLVTANDDPNSNR
jgi:teichuronic acid biosynthesis glycosyltransferase TuaC